MNLLRNMSTVLWIRWLSYWTHQFVFTSSIAISWYYRQNIRRVFLVLFLRWRWRKKQFQGGNSFCRQRVPWVPLNDAPQMFTLDDFACTQGYNARIKGACDAVAMRNVTKIPLYSLYSCHHIESLDKVALLERILKITIWG